MQVNAIILAGGKSKRMGVDKPLMSFNGETLLERSVMLCKSFFKDVIISSQNPKHQVEDCKIVPDLIEGCGPIGGIHSCLKISDTEWNFVMSVDAPFLEPAFISLLISETDGYDAVIPVHNSGIEPLLGIYRKRSLLQMEKQIADGNYKMHDLLDHLNVNFVDAQSWVDRYPLIFKNLNKPEDFDY